MSVPSSSSDIPLAQRAAPIANGTQARTASEMRELDVDFAQDDSSVAGAYPRVDGGREAWLFLAGAFTIEMLVWYVLCIASILVTTGLLHCAVQIQRDCML